MPGGAPLPQRAEWIGYGSIVPFALCLAGMAALPSHELRDLAQRIAIAYGAVVLAFSGAVHWGLALAGRIAWRPLRIVGAILPAVAGATATVLSGQRGLALLVVGFGGLWLYEHRSVAGELPPAFIDLKRNFTLAVCALLTLTMFLSQTVGLP